MWDFIFLGDPGVKPVFVVYSRIYNSECKIDKAYVSEEKWRTIILAFPSLLNSFNESWI